jgi:predicted glycosyltransferase
VSNFRVFCYVQHLSGVGHMVRTQHIAVTLARRHRVSILDGGRELPFPRAVRRVKVPRITRCEGELLPLDGDLSLSGAFELRQRQLQQFLEREVPDALLVEHFPFSKWELTEEIEFVMDRARRLNPRLRVICSLRDIAPRTRFEDPEGYERFVLQKLDRHFDALLVHADTRLCSLGDSFPQQGSIAIPIHHTGIVAPETAPEPPARRPPLSLDAGHIVASIGGGADDAGLLSRVERAWRHLVAEGVVGSRVLLLFGGLNDPDAAAGFGDKLRERACYMGFDPAFRHWLQGASLSISCAGYNTCASLLQAGTPALLMPNPRMSDQAERARLLAEHGVARVIPPEGGAPDPLPGMIARALETGPANHAINIEGAAESARYIEQLVSGEHVH